MKSKHIFQVASFQKWLKLLLVIVLLLLAWILLRELDQSRQAESISSIPQAPLTVDELRQILMRNDLCQLPCFLGFVPGTTIASDVLAFAPVEEEISARERYSTTLHVYEDDIQSSPFVFSFTIDNDFLYEVSFAVAEASQWLPPNSLDMPSLLSRQREPSDIYLAINLTTFQVSVAFYYNAMNAMVQYILQLEVAGDVFSSQSDDPLLLCPHLDSHQLVRLWSRTRSTETVAQPSLPESYLGGFDTDPQSSRYWDVQSMTGLNADTFVMKIIDEPGTCIELPSYKQLIASDYPG